MISICILYRNQRISQNNHFRGILRENSTRSILKVRDSHPVLSRLQSFKSVDESNSPSSYRNPLSPIPNSDSLPNTQKSSNTSSESSPPPTMRVSTQLEMLLSPNNSKPISVHRVPYSRKNSVFQVIAPGGKSPSSALRRRGSESSTSSSGSSSQSSFSSAPPVVRKMGTAESHNNNKNS